MQYQLENNRHAFSLAGMITLALRLVTGWTYFSAFWRRLILENKLDPEQAGYIGEKFNHFLPNALLIGPGIEYLVSNPDTLWWFMLIFTVVEAVVGLFFILGLFTRLMSIGVFGLAMGILLGAGWLGTTCLDEWQIGVLGIAAGFTIFLSGGGPFSMDHYLRNRAPGIYRNGRLWFLGSGIFKVRPRTLKRLVLTGAIGIFLLTLGTNQYFHGGLWGTLHNKSVRPNVLISEPTLEEDYLAFTVFRNEGADVYGSFLIGISLYDESGKAILELNGEQLANFPPENIKNSYVSKVKPGKHSLILPLGAKARLTIRNEQFGTLPKGNFLLVLRDISGVEWRKLLVSDR